MNILFHPNNHRHVRGLASSLNEEHKCLIYSPNQSLYDVLYQFNPDLLVCMREDIQPIHQAATTEFPHVRLIVIDDLNLESAAMVGQFHQLPPSPKHKSDIAYIDMGHNIVNTPWLNNIIAITPPNTDYTIKCFGSNRLPIPEYFGGVDLDDINHLISSTQIVIDINGTILHEAAYVKTFCISNIKNNYFPHATDLLLFRERIKFYMDPQNLSCRTEIVEKAHAQITQGNTYTDRAQQLLKFAKTNTSQAMSSEFVEAIT